MAKKIRRKVIEKTTCVEMDKMCRICLQDRAELPIFDDAKSCEDEKNESIKYKLFTCLREEVQETEGYPRNICRACNDTLDTIYKFIQTYKESCLLLERDLEKRNLQIRDTEEEIFLEDIAELDSESDLTLANIKIEFDLECGQPETLEVEEVVSCRKRIKKENCARKKRRKIYAEEVPVVREKKIRSVSTVKKTNHIATSLLEGVYCWSGMKWSYASKMTVLPQLKTKREVVRSLRRELPRRKRKVQVKSDRKRLCDLCGTVFPNQAKLTIHKKKMHNQAMKCDAVGCSKVCNGPKNLRLHKARKHGCEREHVCPTCGKAFSFKSDLYNHSKRHRKDFKKKEFSCSMCDKTYKCQKSVDIHERSVHTGVRPASCTVCDAAFFHEDYLKEHTRLHTGETPFHCPVCGRGYAQRCNMKSHMRSHRFADVDEQTRAKMKPNYIKLLKL